MDKNNKKKLIVIAVFSFIFLLRMIKIGNPPLDYSSWRQVDTDSMARNFNEYNFNIFYPQLNYDGPMPNYVQLEFQITTFIIAIIYNLFGYNIILARLVPILFFMGSCLYLYLLAKYRSGIDTAIFTVLVYGILPINLVYSRNIMPESSMLFFMIGGIYYFDQWIDDLKFSKYVLALVFTTLAILSKLPSAMIGIPMIYISFKKFGWNTFKNMYLYLFAAFVLGLPLIYYKWLGSIAEQKYVSGIGAGMILPNLKNITLSSETVKYLSRQFSEKIFTIPGIILFSIGLIIKKEKKEYLYYAWTGAAILHILLIDGVIHLDYYLIFITPIISIFIGYAMAHIAKDKRYRYLSYLSLVIIYIYGAAFMREAYKLQFQYVAIGDNVSRVTSYNDLIIIGKDSPELLYTCNRKGWRLYGDILTKENINDLITKGAKYFVPASADIDNALKKSLDTCYQRIDFTDGFYIYKLR